MERLAMGTVVDKSKAFKKCTCYKISDKPWPKGYLCYSSGVLGAMTDVQDLQCKRASKKDAPAALMEHLEEFGDVSKDCAIGNKYKGFTLGR